MFEYMELTTGLMIAIKEAKVKTKEADEHIQKEIGYMQSLRHVSQSDDLSSKIRLLILCSKAWLSIS